MDRYEPSIPVVRLTVEGFRHQILAALTNHQLAIDQSMQQAVEDFCKPENLEVIIQREVKSAIQRAVEEEVQRFYRTGDGRYVVREAVLAALTPEAERAKRRTLDDQEKERE